MSINQELKSFLVNPINSNLDKIVTSTHFIHNFKNIFQDEEYMDGNMQFVKCYSCENESIGYEEFSNPNFQYLLDKAHYSFKEQNIILREVSIFQKIYDLYSRILVVYCKKCYRILNLYYIPYVFFMKSYGEIYKNLDTLYLNCNLKDHVAANTIHICPNCGSNKLMCGNKKYYKYDITEFDVICGTCDFNIVHYSYDLAFDYPIYNFPILDEVVFHFITPDSYSRFYK